MYFDWLLGFKWEIIVGWYDKFWIMLTKFANLINFIICATFQNISKSFKNKIQLDE